MPATPVGSLSIEAVPVDTLPAVLAVYGAEMPLGVPLDILKLRAHLIELIELGQPAKVPCFLMVSGYLPAPRVCAGSATMQPAYMCQQPVLVKLTQIEPFADGGKPRAWLAGYYQRDSEQCSFTCWLSLGAPQVGILRIVQTSARVCGS